MTTITREQALKIIEAADEVISALAGTNEDVHPGSDNMLRLWDDLNDRYAPPEVVRELARIALASLERERVRHEHAKWSDPTFGCVGPIGPLKHLSKEALEAAAEPDDLSEWADMQFLLWDAQRRAGISDAEITAAMENKLKINMERQWPEPKDGEPRLHIKEPGNSPVTPDGWISCSELMPDDGQHVIILCDGAFVLYAQYRDGEFFDIVRNGDEFFETQSRNVTDWMQLPEPPL
ncbi:dATP/dGTP pyrophosphohydrolase domain-containing protein [Escherichia coli]|uniref:dATP/dGTP pyrophosphohydrolase domain-containing protein n=1 Tax=Escherichia coli TaxID=562 RepID=UPI000DDC96F9